jgi:hypothetical protein
VAASYLVVSGFIFALAKSATIEKPANLHVEPEGAAAD